MNTEPSTYAGDIITESGVNISHDRREKAKHGDQWIPKRDETGKKHVVNVSGGLCSFWAWKRVVDNYGPKNVIPLFADRGNPGACVEASAPIFTAQMFSFFASRSGTGSHSEEPGGARTAPGTNGHGK